MDRNIHNRLSLLLLILLACCSDSKEYKIKFDHVDRLSEGDKIFIRGMNVGNVKHFEILDNNKIVVTISITKDIKVTTGSKFVLHSSVTGFQYIEIELAALDNGFVDRNQMLTGETKPMDSTGYRRLTQEELDSILKTIPQGQLVDSVMRLLKSIYNDKKKNGQ